MKTFNDPIHGHIDMPQYLIDIIDTPEFQRLRELKQLGVSYYVFPGATHNRFEHSIGTSYLAGKMVRYLKENQPELLISDRDVKCVEIAGLCHDLGHGPFSHLFDGLFMPMLGKPFEHELQSERMLEHLVKEHQLPIPDKDLLFIKDLIHGLPRSSATKSEKRFLFEIVANKRNSIDVDKFDYLARDCFNIGLKSSVDTNRLLTLCRVVDNQICFNQKEAYNIYELFHMRYSLFKRVYTHRVTVAIDYMICDILLLAEPVLKISDMVQDVEAYLNLNDSILSEIARSKDPNLKPAQDLLLRLRKRQLYRFADQVIIPSDLIQSVTKQDINAKQIVKFQSPLTNLVEDDVIVDWLILNYALKDKNPVDHCMFFHKDSPTIVHQLNREDVSIFIPNVFTELTIRVYSRHPDKCMDIQIAFRNLLDHLNQRLDSQPLTALSLEHSQPDMLQIDRLPRTISTSSATSSRNPSPSKSRLKPNEALTLDSPHKQATTEYLGLKRKKLSFD
ncbi:hypothetical protein EDD86DRAFT_213604 [Gorgonomyces haynaldii]|nr:hypothetical protein EDD86DRAFT_213604 [Gorgonomyces haynaldii]